MIITYQSSAGTERNVWYCVEKNHKTNEKSTYSSVYDAPKAYVTLDVE